MDTQITLQGGILTFVAPLCSGPKKELFYVSGLLDYVIIDHPTFKDYRFRRKEGTEQEEREKNKPKFRMF